MKLPITPVEKFEGWSLIDADGVEIASGMAAGRDMGESDAKYICEAVNKYMFFPMRGKGTAHEKTIAVIEKKEPECFDLSSMD